VGSNQGRDCNRSPVSATSILAYLIVLVAMSLRLYQLQFGQWRNDEEIIWLHALRAVAARQFSWVGIPSDLGIANGPAQMLPVLPAAVLQAPYIAYVLVAMLNVLAVAALSRLGRLWGGSPLGLAAAALCAVSPWATIHSRRLWGNDMLAPFAVLFITALWLFAARRQRWRIVNATVWLALVVQMYIAAIVHVAVLAVGLAFAAIAYGRRLHGIIVPLIVACLVFILLTAGYGMSAFLGHATDLARAVRDTRAATPQPHGLPNWDGIGFLIQSVRSDGYRFYAPHASRLPSLGGGPVVVGDAIAEALLFCGVVFLFMQLVRAILARQPSLGVRLTTPALLLTWLLAMPISLVLHDAPVCACFLLPSYPAQYLVEAIGAVAVGGVVAHLLAGVAFRAGDRVPASATPADRKVLMKATSRPFEMHPSGVGRLITGTLLGVVLLCQLGAAGPFFAGINQYWPNDQYGLPYAFHGRIVKAIAYVWRPGMSIVVSGHGELDGVLRDEIDTELPAGQARIVDDQRWLTLPAPGQAPMIMLMTPGASAAHDALAALVQARPAALQATLTVPGANQEFRILQVTANDTITLEGLLTPTSDRHVAAVQFATDVRLDRYALPIRLLPAHPVNVALEWTILRSQPFIPADSFYVHLVDATGTTAMLDAPFLPPNLWRQGERVWTFGALSDSGHDNATRDVLIGLYKLKGTDASEGVISIPATDSSGHAITELRQGPYVVHAATVAPADDPTLKENFAPGLALVSADVPTVGTAGASLAITLHWQATSSSPPRYTVFLHLLDPRGTLQAQQDIEPDSGALPTSAWLLHELVDDTHILKLPPNIVPGEYRLVLGVYPTGQPEHPRSMTWPQEIRVEASGHGA
jgi:hypothetical protein